MTTKATFRKARPKARVVNPEPTPPPAPGILPLPPLTPEEAAVTLYDLFEEIIGACSGLQREIPLNERYSRRGNCQG